MNYSKPLVSVIMPVLGNEEYVTEAIQSIISQTYQNIELILIDENRHDLCFDIVNSFGDERIKYYKGPQRNLSYALNMGIGKAQGEYIARMDSDDIADINRISVQMDYLKKNNWQICGTWIQLFGVDSRLYTYPEKSNDIKYAMLFTCAMAHPTVLGEAALFHKFTYDVTSAAEDHELWTRMLRDNIVFGNVPIALLKYRRHVTAVTSSVSDKQSKDSIRLLENYATYLLSSEETIHFTKLSCGAAKEYSLEEITELCDFMYELIQKKALSRDLLIKMMPAYFRKSNVITSKLFFLYFKLLKKYKLPILAPETFYMAVLSLFNIDRSSNIYRFVKKYIVSSS